MTVFNQFFVFETSYSFISAWKVAIYIASLAVVLSQHEKLQFIQLFFYLLAAVYKADLINNSFSLVID